MTPLQAQVRDRLAGMGISPGWRAFLASSRPCVIYGAGRQATVVYDFCNMLGKPCRCLVAKDSRNRWGLLPGEDVLPLYLLDAVPASVSRANHDVIIAVNPVWNAEVGAALAAHGWTNVLASDNWETDNALTREVFYREYLQRGGARFAATNGAETVIAYDGPRGPFRIYYDIDAVYKSALLGDINNIILPIVFGDQSHMGAYGPYEYGPVRLKPGDTVLDLGANIGMFSCAAASLGCVVHAFEPTQETVDAYLKKNAALYDAITVNAVAVMDEEKRYPFFVNNNFNESSNITRHSMFRHLEPNYKEIEVPATTVDNYVQAAGLEHVDFIKSHTEYSELNLIKGATRTLAAFGPRLALTATNTDQLMEEIRKANPRYVFHQNWYRLFGWVA